MPRMRIKVTLDRKRVDEPEQEFEVVADGRDIRKYEAEYEQSFLTHTDYTQVCQVAHTAMRRQGLYVGSWEQFNGECVDVEEVAEPVPAGPTLPDPGDDS